MQGEGHLIFLDFFKRKILKEDFSEKNILIFSLKKNLIFYRQKP